MSTARLIPIDGSASICHNKPCDGITYFPKPVNGEQKICIEVSH